MRAGCHAGIAQHRQVTPNLLRCHTMLTGQRINADLTICLQLHQDG
jgi:hypothetical protein